MSYEHTTIGFDNYETFVLSLKTLGVPYVEESKSEVYIRGWDGSCMCYCGYSPFGLDMTRLLKHVQAVIRWVTENPELEISAEELEARIQTDEGLAHKFLEMGFRETCPCCTETCGHRQNLRICRFTTPDNRSMVAEEYLAVDDHDCDGTSVIAIEVYPAGERPNLEKKVRVIEV